MKYLGLTTKEWYAFGIGSAINGALFGVMIHSLFFLVLNGLCLGINLYLFDVATGKENGSDN